MSRYSPFDLTDRRAAGHPNGYCHECGRPAASPEADFCSPGCRASSLQRQARQKAMAAQVDRRDELADEARTVAGPEGEDRD